MANLDQDASGANAAELHKAMVEQALHGYDVQPSAGHFAATRRLKHGDVAVPEIDAPAELLRQPPLPNAGNQDENDVGASCVVLGAGELHGEGRFQLLSGFRHGGPQVGRVQGLQVRRRLLRFLEAIPTAVCFIDLQQPVCLPHDVV